MSKVFHSKSTLSVFPPQCRNEPSWQTTLSMETVHSPPHHDEEGFPYSAPLPRSSLSQTTESSKSPSVALRERLMHGPTTTESTAASLSVVRTFYSVDSSRNSQPSRSVSLPATTAIISSFSSAPLVDGFCLSPERAWKSCESTRTTNSSAPNENENGKTSSRSTRSEERRSSPVQKAHYFYSSSTPPATDFGADCFDDSPAPAPRPSCSAIAAPAPSSSMRTTGPSVSVATISSLLSVTDGPQSCAASPSPLPLIYEGDDEESMHDVNGKKKENENEGPSKITVPPHPHTTTTTSSTSSLALRIAQRLLEQSSNRHVERQLLARQHKKEAMEKLMRTGGGSSGGSLPSHKQ